MLRVRWVFGRLGCGPPPFFLVFGLFSVNIPYMANVSYIEIPEHLIILFNKLIKQVDKKKTGSVAKQGHLMSRAQKKKVSTRSLLPVIRDYWAGLSDAQKLAWKNAGAESSYNGWNLFVQDTAYRLKYEIEGVATPSTLHQYKVGKIVIAAPADDVKLVQYHPYKYYRLKKITGTKAQYEDVAIYERLVLPLSIGLSFKTDLTPQSEEAYARFYATIKSHYQGRNIDTNFVIDLPFEADWTRETLNCTEVLGVARDYNLWLDIHDCRGELFFDNIRAVHTGTNWARDFRCNDVNNRLTKVNYQIEPSWEEQLLPAGAAFDSVYPE